MGLEAASLYNRLMDLRRVIDDAGYTQPVA